MKVTVRNYFGDEVDEFRDDLSALDREVKIERPPAAPLQMAGPGELVQISIDPQTLRLIFEYVSALVITGTFATLVKKFLEALADELGKQAAGKIVAALAKLWQKLHARVRTQQSARIYVGLDFKLSDCSVSIDDSVFPSHVQSMMQGEEMVAFCLLLFRLIPLVDEFAKAAKKRDLKLGDISVMLMYAQEPWHWFIRIPPLGEFWLEPDGIFRPAYDESQCGLSWWTRRRLRRHGIGVRDIDALVRAHRRTRS
jgi:hypothetical protein